MHNAEEISGLYSRIRAIEHVLEVLEARYSHTIMLEHDDIHGHCIEVERIAYKDFLHEQIEQIRHELNLIKK